MIKRRAAKFQLRVMNRIFGGIPESSSAARMENTSSSEAETASEPETTSESETAESTAVPEEPEESDSGTAPEPEETETEQDEAENREMQMNVQVGGSTFTAALEENEAVDALVDMMEQGSVTIQMSDYSGFEKVGPLGTIPGAIPGWAISMILPAGKRLWAAAM